MKKMNENVIQRTKDLIEEVGLTHRYSMSRIYSLYNEIFETNERPQSCASCLIRKVNELRKWLNEQQVVEKETKTSVKRKKKTSDVKAK